MKLFSSLKELSIDMEFIRLLVSVAWPSLRTFQLRGIYHININGLQAFLNRHQQIMPWHLAVVSNLRPLEP